MKYVPPKSYFKKNKIDRNPKNKKTNVTSGMKIRLCKANKRAKNPILK
jgi:hypothetical protein